MCDRCKEYESQLAAAKEWRGFICGVIHQHPEFSKPGAITELDKILSGDFQCPGCEKKNKELYDSIEQVYLRDKDITDKSRRLEMARESWVSRKALGYAKFSKAMNTALAADAPEKEDDGD